MHLDRKWRSFLLSVCQRKVLIFNLIMKLVIKKNLFYRQHNNVNGKNICAAYVFWQILSKYRILLMSYIDQCMSDQKFHTQDDVNGFTNVYFR